MKYIKKFESKTKRDKLKVEVEINEQFIPGSYLIFNFSRYSFKLNKLINFLILAQIINAKKSILDSCSLILTVRIINYEYDFEELNDDEIKNSIISLHISEKNFRKIYTSVSLKDSTEKYNELKNSETYKKWEIDRNINKYNL